MAWNPGDRTDHPAFGNQEIGYEWRGNDRGRFFCFSAMAGEFPGAPSTDALWHLLCEGQIAPVNSMLTRWELNKASIYSAKAGEKDRVYLDSAFFA
ncbi:hypothetical protein ACFS4T_18970 [Pseudomonas lini]